jgi:hypothetical protein
MVNGLVQGHSSAEISGAGAWISFEVNLPTIITAILEFRGWIFARRKDYNPLTEV